MIEDEVVNFTLNGYSKFYPLLTRQQINEFLELFKENTIIIKNGNELLGIGFYLRLNDYMFEQIKNRDFDISKPENIKICLENEGENINFIGVIANGVKTILQGLREVIIKERPKSISWFSPNMENFFIRNITNYKEMLICHQ